MAENMNVAAVAQQVTPQLAQSRTADVESVQQPEPSAKTAEAAAISVEELQAAIDTLNEFMKQGQRSLSFSVDNSADEVVVQVVDTETKELVRQIPNEETLRIKQHLESMLGLLFNETA